MCVLAMADFERFSGQEMTKLAVYFSRPGFHDRKYKYMVTWMRFKL